MARETALTIKAHEQALEHAVRTKEYGLARELAAVKAQAAEADAKSQKLAQELRDREATASRSVERERSDSRTNAVLIKYMQDMQSALKDESRNMTEAAQQSRTDMKRCMEEQEERRSMRSARWSSAKESGAIGRNRQQLSWRIASKGGRWAYLVEFLCSVSKSICFRIRASK